MKKVLLILTLLLLFPGFVNAEGKVSISKKSIEVLEDESETFNIDFINCAGKIEVTISDNSLATLNVDAQVQDRNGNSYFVDNESLLVEVLGKSEGSAKILVKIIDVATYDEEQLPPDIYEIDLKVKSNKKISNIKVEKMPKQLKYPKDSKSISLKGGKIKITYDDKTSKIVDMESNLIDIVKFDTSKIGKSKVVLQYRDKTFNIEIKVTGKKSSNVLKLISIALLLIFILLLLKKKRRKK